MQINDPVNPEASSTPIMVVFNIPDEDSGFVNLSYETYESEEIDPMLKPSLTLCQKAAP